MLTPVSRGGANVRLRGVPGADYQLYRRGRVDSFRLHPSCREAVRILREPPCFNQRRLGIALASTLGVMTFSCPWIVSSARKNRRLKTENREREKLTTALQRGIIHLGEAVESRNPAAEPEALD